MVRFYVRRHLTPSTQYCHLVHLKCYSIVEYFCTHQRIRKSINERLSEMSTLTLITIWWDRMHKGRNNEMKWTQFICVTSVDQRLVTNLLYVRNFEWPIATIRHRERASKKEREKKRFIWQSVRKVLLSFVSFVFIRTTNNRFVMRFFVPFAASRAAVSLQFQLKYSLTTADDDKHKSSGSNLRRHSTKTSIFVCCVYVRRRTLSRKRHKLDFLVGVGFILRFESRPRTFFLFFDCLF